MGPFPKALPCEKVLGCFGEGLLVWGSCGPLPYWVPQTLTQGLAGGWSKQRGECRRSLEPESPPAAALRWMWLGEVAAPTHHLVQSLFTAHGASLSSAQWVDWVGGWGHVVGERRDNY